MALHSCRAGDFDAQKILFKPAESKKDLVLIYRSLELFLPVQTTKGGYPTRPKQPVWKASLEIMIETQLYMILMVNNI